MAPTMKAMGDLQRLQHPEALRRRSISLQLHRRRRRLSCSTRSAEDVAIGSVLASTLRSTLLRPCDSISSSLVVANFQHRHGQRRVEQLCSREHLRTSSSSAHTEHLHPLSSSIVFKLVLLQHQAQVQLRCGDPGAPLLAALPPQASAISSAALPSLASALIFQLLWQ